MLWNTERTYGVNMKPLDPTIYRISKHYGFSWNYDKILDKWVVKSTGDKYTDTDFYWSSEYSFEDFLDRLKSYFMSMGYYS